MKTLIQLEIQRFNWSLETFPHATSLESILKAKQEILEIQENIEAGIKDPVEYADAIMCILDAAQREGISVSKVLNAYEEKIKINKNRSWVRGEDGTYSHIIQ